MTDRNPQPLFCQRHPQAMLVRDVRHGVAPVLRCPVCEPNGIHAANLDAMMAELRAAQTPKTYRVIQRNGRRVALPIEAPA
jgi:hypothetical protein